MYNQTQINEISLKEKKPYGLIISIGLIIIIIFIFLIKFLLKKEKIVLAKQSYDKCHINFQEMKKQLKKLPTCNEVIKKYIKEINGRITEMEIFTEKIKNKK